MGARVRMPVARTLWLVRHAAVQAEPGLCYGRSEVPADAAATAAAAAALAPRLPRGAALRVSPLGRCQQLAEALRALRPDLQGRLDARLAEMDFGAWELRRWAEIERAAFDAWLADFADARPGGGESVRAFMQRVGAAWDEAVRGAAGTDGGDEVWLTHAGVLRAARLLHAGVRCPVRAADWPREAAPFGAALCLRLPGAGDRGNGGRGTGARGA